MNVYISFAIHYILCCIRHIGPRIVQRNDEAGSDVHVKVVRVRVVSFVGAALEALFFSGIENIAPLS